MPRKQSPVPNPVEMQILNVLWDKGWATVREVHEVLSRMRPLAYTSVLSMLQFMEKKALVTHKQDGRAYRYRSARSRRQTLRRLVSDIVARAFSSSPEMLIEHIIEEEDISPEELKRLKKLLEEKEKNK